MTMYCFPNGAEYTEEEFNAKYATPENVRKYHASIGIENERHLDELCSLRCELEGIYNTLDDTFALVLTEDVMANLKDAIDALDNEISPSGELITEAFPDLLLPEFDS